LSSVGQESAHLILVQLTDLHIRPRGKSAYRTSETNMLSERALRTVARLKLRPDAIIISGDLTDDGTVGEYAIFADMLRRHISAPVYVIPGNHDRREVMKEQLAHLPGVAEHPEFIQYVVDDHELRLVMLDTVIPDHGAGELCAQRMEWLSATLAAAPDRSTVIAMHHPPFLCGIGHMDAISLRNKEAFAALIAKHPQVKRIICGHNHRPIIGQVAHAVASISPSVAHQVEFSIGADPGFWNLEPAAFQVLVTMPQDSIVTHTVYVEDFPGPFPFSRDAD
jgi:3',5'-cyclic AMP phosphodiesterase CpdA